MVQPPVVVPVQVSVTEAEAELFAVFVSCTLPETIAVSFTVREFWVQVWDVENVSVMGADSPAVMVPTVHWTLPLDALHTTPLLVDVPETKMWSVGTGLLRTTFVAGDPVFRTVRV